ncbi:hypothetical protein FFLO_04764 [Filobasidium floriforme]|uniref:Uncharacterized protein n=1 Tax=Filobasidium floriforme TaxID=5210 RepID=A0A8K0JI49_9TREE|nr:uncharacterized protein HD553DRAFT_357718 [Filobasidium floriforme]KAG7530857.1 hypothetical protein FFLO_04764 [Filobasidium floriforme]KAH8082530.1 hypothetical protein HD553DRAFT_357718 [Filobasidium floriforme]
MHTDVSHVYQRRQLRISLIAIFVTVAPLARPDDKPKFEFELDQMSFFSSIFPTVTLVLGLFTPFPSKIKGYTFFHWLMDRCSTSLLAGLVAMPIPTKSPEQLPHRTPESTLLTTPNSTPLDIPISQRPHPTYAEKSRAVYQSRQAAKLRLDALNAPAARRREVGLRVWGMRRLSPLRCETKVEYDDLGEPSYHLRHITPVETEWRSYPARVPLHPDLRNTQNNGLWGPKRSSLTVEDLARDLPRVRPIPKLARLGFVDLGPPFERKRFPSAMEVYITSCKIRVRRIFRFQDEDTIQLDRSL